MANPKTVIKDYFEKTNLTDQNIAEALGVSYVTVGRWRRGERIPQKYHFNRLKQIVHGHTAGEIEIQKPPGNELTMIIAHIDRLSSQITYLQGEVAVLKDRQERFIGDSEKKIGELMHCCQAVTTETREMANRLPRPQKTGNC